MYLMQLEQNKSSSVHFKYSQNSRIFYLLVEPVLSVKAN